MLFHGSECWTSAKVHLRRLEMTDVCRIDATGHRMTLHKCNEEITEELGLSNKHNIEINGRTSEKNVCKHNPNAAVLIQTEGPVGWSVMLKMFVIIHSAVRTEESVRVRHLTAGRWNAYDQGSNRQTLVTCGDCLIAHSCVIKSRNRHI
jgi:hypothetical protein